MVADILSIRLRYLLLFLTILAALVYGVAGWLVGPSVVFADSMDYQTTAQRLVHTGVYEHNATPTLEIVEGASARIMPGYAFFLAAFYRCIDLTENVHSNIEVVRPWVCAVQMILAVASATLIALCGFLLEGKRGALIAGLLSIFYVPIGINAMYLGNETLTLFLTVAMILSVIGMLRTQDWRIKKYWAVALGLSTAATVLTRPSILLWFAVPLFALLVFERKNWRNALLIGAIAIGSFTLLMAPWVVRNALLYREFIPLNNSSSEPFFASTGPPTLTDEEKTIFDQAIADGLDGYQEVALYRLRTRWEAGRRSFIEWRWAPVALSLKEYTDMPSSVLAYFDATMAQRDDMLQRYEGRYVFPAKPQVFESAKYLFAQRLFRLYHIVLLGGFILGTGMVLLKRQRSLLVLVTLPLYFTLVHFMILANTRYFYYNIPVYILVSMFLIVALYQLAQRNV